MVAEIAGVAEVAEVDEVAEGAEVEENHRRSPCSHRTDRCRGLLQYVGSAQLFVEQHVLHIPVRPNVGSRPILLLCELQEDHFVSLCSYSTPLLYRDLQRVRPREVCCV